MRGSRAEQGFTLIEMIVVMVIMSLIAGMVLVRQPWHSSSFDLDATLRAFTDALRLARSRAIAQDRDVAVVTAVNGFSVDGGPAWLLPAAAAMSPSRIIFLPDGGSTGGSIRLGSGERRVAVDVNWMTGAVRSHELTTQ